MCNRGDLLVGYIYDEISDRDRREVEAHLATCGDCRDEVEGLRSTRGHLALWAPPQPELGFRIVSGSAAPAPVQALPRRRFAPAFAFAAAAVIVLAVAAAIANVEVRYGTDGMTLRTGWARSAESPTVTAPQGEAARLAQSSTTTDVAALEARLTEIERVFAQAGSRPGVQNASATGMSDAELLQRVRQMLRDAEQRQETAVAQQLLQVVRDLDRQRRSDWALIQQGLGQYQGVTNAEIANTRDQINQLIRANSKQER